MTVRFSPIELTLKDAAKKIFSTTQSFKDRRDYVRDAIGVDTWKRVGAIEVTSIQGPPSQESPKSARIFSVPKPSNGKFCGRKEVLEQLDRDLLPAQSSPQKTCTLHGAPGMGKTQIALEFAYRCCGTFPELHIFWVPAEDETVLSQAFGRIARLVGGQQAGQDVTDQARLVETATAWLCESESSRCVILWKDSEKRHTHSLVLGHRYVMVDDLRQCQQPRHLQEIPTMLQSWLDSRYQSVSEDNTRHDKRDTSEALDTPRRFRSSPRPHSRAAAAEYGRPELAGASVHENVRRSQRIATGPRWNCGVHRFLRSLGGRSPHSAAAVRKFRQEQPHYERSLRLGVRSTYRLCLGYGIESSP